MGYAMVISKCVACQKLIRYNPHKVPSIRVNGVREAICEGCYKLWHKLHDVPYEPPMEGAYEPFDEQEL